MKIYVMSCKLIGDAFGFFIQILLFVGAITLLIYKRSIENPKRTWLIWLFDTSKQAVSGSLQHGVNLILGLYFGSFNGKASECSWYILNFTITCFCGLAIISLIMAFYNIIVNKYKLLFLVSGYYGNPPSYKPWLIQLLLWAFISCFEKFITAIIIILPLYKYLDYIAYNIEIPLKNYPHIELIIVMVILPIMINSVFFWVCDNILKNKKNNNLIENNDSTYLQI